MEEPRKTLEELKALRVIDLRKMLSELGLPGSGMGNLTIMTCFAEDTNSEFLILPIFEPIIFLEFVVEAKTVLKTNF